MADKKPSNAIRNINRMLEFFGIRRNTEDESVPTKQLTEDLIMVKQHSSFELSKLPNLDNENRQIQDPSKVFNEMISTAEEIIEDNKALNALNPEIGLARSILVSSIISPNDLQTGSLLVTCPIPGLESEIQTKVTEYLSNYFNKELDLATSLEEWLGSALFVTGASPVMTVPRININTLGVRDSVIKYHQSEDVSYLTDMEISTEAITSDIDSIDLVEVENVVFRELEHSLEAAKPQKGIAKKTLKSQTKISSKKLAENMVGKVKRSSKNLTITSNVSEIKNVQKISKILSSARAKIDKQFIGLIGETGQNGTPLFVLSDEEMESDDYCTHIELPASAVIPVCVPGSSTQHIGYYVAVDNWGTPIDPDNLSLKNRCQQEGVIQEMIANSFSPNVKNAILGESSNFQEKFRIASAAFGITVANMLERNFSRISGADKEYSVSVREHSAISNCLMYHMLTEQQIKLVFVPESLMTYYAFDYRDSGMGKSLVEGLSYLLSLRTTLMVARTMATLREAIDHKTIEVDIPESDMNPLGTLQAIRDIYLMKKYPKFSNNPTVAMQGIMSASVDVVPNNIPGMETSMKVTKDHESKSISKPDDSIMEELGDMISLGLGVPPSAINKLKEDEFAISVATNNLFFNNNVRRKQRVTVGCNNKLGRNSIKYSSKIKNDLLTIMKDTKLFSSKSDDDDSESADTRSSKLISAVMNNLNIGLASPNIAATKSQLEEMNSYMDTVEKIVETTFSDDLFGIDDRDAAETVKSIRAMLSNKMIRQFVATSGLSHVMEVPEVEDLPTDDIRDFFTMVKNLNRGMVNLKAVLDNEDSEDGGGSSGSGW